MYILSCLAWLLDCGGGGFHCGISKGKHNKTVVLRNTVTGISWVIYIGYRYIVGEPNGTENNCAGKADDVSLRQSKRRQ